jgi:hypothetical protein
MAVAYSVPGVYFDQRPRTPEAPIVRTDIAGFIGFEPRVREVFDPAGAIRVEVSSLQLLIKDLPVRVNGTVLELAATPAAILSPGQSVVFAIVAAGDLPLVKVPGSAAPSGLERTPDDNAVEIAVETKSFVRIADVIVRRDASAVFITIVPALALTRCDDFRDYLLAFGPPPDDGTLLGPSVRAFFANGGRRCWVATVRRPNFVDTIGLQRARDEMVGIAGAGEVEATGFERLLILPEVTFVDAPDLYARRVDLTTQTIPLPARENEGCFIRCPDFIGPAGTATSTNREPAFAALFSTDDVFETQRRMLERAIPERWRMLLLFSVPRHLDPAIGRFVPPTSTDARDWAARFAGLADPDELSVAALYWPWVLDQEQVDAPLLEMPPSAYAAGVIARRDLARGPQISPANETLKQVVGLSATFDDVVHGGLYSPEPPGGFVPSVNVLRSFPGYGIQVWGARTLSTERWLRFLAVRRTLTAIELRMKTALDVLVFEPNAPGLWLRITQIAFSVLFPIFESGALRGARPEEAFYVRCDAGINPPDSVALGLVIVEVGVAVAAPMEFIVFRLGRREGVVEVVE